MTHRFQSWPAIAGRPASTILSGRDSRDVLIDAYAYHILDDYDIAAGNQMVVGTDFNWASSDRSKAITAPRPIFKS